MGLCRSKLFLTDKNFNRPKKSNENILLNRSISVDTEMLIPQRVINNSYLTYDSCSSEIKFQFRVCLLNDNLKSIRKGHLVMTKNDLIFYQNDMLSVVLAWPMTTLRWYAYSHNLFIFQCGRKASTGEGTFIFSCNEYQVLKESFDVLMLENSFNLNFEDHPNLSALKDNCRITKCKFLRQNSAIDSNILKTPSEFNSHPQFNRSQSVNATSNRLSVDRYAMLRDFTTLPNVRRLDTLGSNISDLTSSGSTLSSDAVNQSNISTAENYLTGVGNGPPVGQYLIAVAAETLHGYINQNDTQDDPTLVNSQPAPDNIFSEYQNFPLVNYSQLAHVNGGNELHS